MLTAKIYSLNEERSGWFEPLPAPVTATILDKGKQFSVEEPASIQELTFPAKQFWILVPDPDNPEFGSFRNLGEAIFGNAFYHLVYFIATTSVV